MCIYTFLFHLIFIDISIMFQHPPSEVIFPSMVDLFSPFFLFYLLRKNNAVDHGLYFINKIFLFKENL